MIGHLKHDCGMGRNRLKGEIGDALNPVLAAARYNLRWLMRAIARLGLRGLFALFRMLASIAFVIAIGHEALDLRMRP